MTVKESSSNNDVTLTYKYLLIFSTLCAVFFCWLYVTKPTNVVQSTNSSEQKDESVDASTLTSSEGTSETSEDSSFDSLDSNSLPGDADTSSYKSIPIAQTPATESNEGFEETNDTIQHILTAQNSTSSERIIIEVPVIYQTRGLRLDPEKAKEAQRVLRALKIYQSQLNKLHQDGLNIQKAWNNLLIASQPIDALRADSPSLPKSSSTHPALLGGNSSNSIQVSE